MALPAACSMQPEPEHLDAWMNLEFAKCCLADFLSPFTFMAVPESSAWLCLQFQLAVSACTDFERSYVQRSTSNIQFIADCRVPGAAGIPSRGHGYGVWRGLGSGL